MNRHLLTRRRRFNYLMVAGDVVLIVAALGLAYALLVATGAASLDGGEMLTRLASWGWLFVAAHGTTLYLLGLYAPRSSARDAYFALKLALAITVGTALISSALFFVPGFAIGRQPLLLHAPILFGLLLLWRGICFGQAFRRGAPRRLAIAGERDAALALALDLKRQALPDYEVVRVYLHDAAPGSRRELPQVPLRLELCQDLGKFLDSADVHAVALDLERLPLAEREVQRLALLSFAGVEVHDLATLHKEVTGRFPPRHVDGAHILAALGARGGSRRAYRRVQRLLDISLSAASLTLAALPMLAIALLVKLESRGPVFFVQERLGYRRRPFRCIKFRTMVEDAERLTGPVWASEDDPRVTRVGSFLRRSRLDELPQLWNVLRGDMALVGPRPIRAHFADKLAQQIPFYDVRFATRPGLTGWAQVNQNYTSSEEDQELKFRYEIFYLENFSLLLDAYTLLKTVRAVVKRRGA